MEVAFLFLFVLVLGHIGFTDYKKRLMSDIGLGTLWMLTALLSNSIPQSLFIMGGIFPIGYLGLYSLPIVAFKKPIMRFGDILLLPPMVAFSFAMFGLEGLSLFAGALGVVMIFSYKKELPFGTVMAFFSLILIGLHYLY